MSVLFIGDGTKTSSIAFSTVTFTNNPVVSSDIIPIEQNIEIIESDAKVRTVYKRGPIQMPMRMKFNLFTEAQLADIMDWKEIIVANWFTLQDQNVKTKTALTVDSGDADTIVADPDLFDWLSPTGRYVIMATGTLAGKRRRIKSYSSSSKLINLDTAFASSVTAGDTFYIGLPVFLTNNPMPRRTPPNWWEIDFVFEELGYSN